MKYGIERKVGGMWEIVRPPTAPPYEFKSEAEAKTIARILYPTEFNNKEAIRIVPKVEA